MKKPTWQSLQNRIRGRFLAPSQQLFANGVMVGDNNKNMNPTGNLTRAQACVLISKSLFKLSEFGSIIDPYLPAPDATAEVNVTYSNQEFSKYGGKGYTVNILEDGI